MHGGWLIDDWLIEKWLMVDLRLIDDRFIIDGWWIYSVVDWFMMVWMIDQLMNEIWLPEWLMDD